MATSRRGWIFRGPFGSGKTAYIEKLNREKLNRKNGLKQ